MHFFPRLWALLGLHVALAILVALLLIPLAAFNREWWFDVVLTVAAVMTIALPAFLIWNVRSIQRFLECFDFSCPMPGNTLFTLILILACAGLQVAYGLVYLGSRLVWPSALAALLWIPRVVAEEILFRGIVFVTFRVRFRFLTSYLLTTLIFAIMHLVGFFDPIFLFGYLSTNLVLCWAFERYGNLWNCVIGHWLYNVALAFAYTVA